jgi:hypothetical protein
VIERGRRFQAARQHAVHQPVVEIEALGIGRAGALGQDPRPGGGEAVGVGAKCRDEVEVFLPAVVVVAGGLPMLGADDIAGGGGETVPMGQARSAEGVAFDLVGGGGDPEEEAFGEIGAG